MGRRKKISPSLEAVSWADQEGSILASCLGRNLSKERMRPPALFDRTGARTL